jgi:ABC-type Fe3+/spermidine/putrescine transport system ATPase subunit
MTVRAPDPAFLDIRAISHSYSDKNALTDVSLQIDRSEVLALLGPSGSGKSTLLSILAGIIQPRSGSITLDGCGLLELPASSRELGMVFQDFALWPHMTVGETVGFPLSVRRVAASEIRRRVAETLTRVDLQGFEKRRPQELSGGQQQRVALARAIVGRTKLLLLDEPLSALDPATRSSIRGDLAELLRKVGLTTIIVTHDREEAFELADRVAILVDGKIQQHGTAEEVYERPANLAVARFMATNLLSVYLPGGSAAVLIGDATQLELGRPARSGPAYLAIVPEQTRVVGDGAGERNCVTGAVVHTQYRGGEYRIRARVGDSKSGQIIEARSKESVRADRVVIQIPPEAIHVIQDAPEIIAKTAVERRTTTTLVEVEEKIA